LAPLKRRKEVGRGFKEKAGGFNLEIANFKRKLL
jgi:hypothetical protein